MKVLTLLLAPVLALISPNLSAGTAQEDLAAEYNSQSGTAIHIVFDDSGSMADDHKMDNAKAAFDQWLAGIPADTKLSLTAINAGHLAQLEPANRDKVREAVQRLNAGGGTPLANKIKEAADEVVKRRKDITPYERHIILIVTDGEDTDVGPAATGKLVKQISDQLNIETVAIGLGGAGNYLRGAAGKYFDANDKKDLLNALSQVNSEVDSTTEPVVSEDIAKRMETVGNKQPVQNSNGNSQVPPRKKSLLERIFGS